MKESKVKKGAAVIKGAKQEAKDVKKKQMLSVKDTKANKRQTLKAKRAKKDPNQPKRPQTAFFIFLEDFRKKYKESHPNTQGVAAVGKVGGEKWKEMSAAEKAVYVNKAAQKKAEYDKAMAAYKNKKQDAEGEDEHSLGESDKSKSEINDEDENDDEEEDDDDDDE